MTPKLKMNLNLFWPVFITAAFFAPCTYAVDADAESRLEKKLQFNRFYEEQILKLAEQQRASGGSAREWTLAASGAVGFDTNPNLVADDPESAYFHEESVSAGFERKDLLDAAGGGNLGVNAYAENTGYDATEDSDESDYVTFIVSPFIGKDFTDSVSLTLEYSYEITHYSHDSSLSYSSHAIAPTLTYEQTENLSHSFIYEYERRNYDDRKAITAFNTDGNKERLDDYHEGAYELNYAWPDKTLLSVSPAYFINDSNDTFEDFNDYDGYRIAAYVYHPINERWAGVVRGGYDFREYEDRAISTSVDTEEDDYFYIGGDLYYSWTPSAQIILSCLYGDNSSNDPDAEYSTFTVSLGLSFIL